MQLLAMPLLAELAAISAASPNAAATTGAAHSCADGHGGEAAPFGQLLAQLQGEGGKGLPPAELAAALGISVEQLQQALAQLRQALADYSRQQTGASGIMPALVDSASDGEATAVNEDGEAFLLWLADQQQGLAGEVDPALVDALQQWLNQHPAMPQLAQSPAGEAVQVDDAGTAAPVQTSNPPSTPPAETKAVHRQEPSAPASNGPTVADVQSTTTMALGTKIAGTQPTTAETTATGTTQTTPRPGVVTGPAVAPAPEQEPIAADSVSARHQATALRDNAAPTNQTVMASEQAAGAAVDQSDGEVRLEAAGEQWHGATPTAGAVQQRGGVGSGDGAEGREQKAVPAPDNEPQNTSPSSPARQIEAALAKESSKTAAGSPLDTAASAANNMDQRNGSPLSAAVQQRGGEGSQGNAGRNGGEQTGGRDGQPNPQETAKLPEGEVDQSQRPMGERLSQWHFQWERASNDAASGITSADSRSEVPDLRQLLNGTTSTLQPTRLTAATSLESSPLLRQFNADPAAALGPQVQVMVARSLDQMTVRLDPQELGSMSIKVQVGADQQVHVQFQVTNPATRDLVEQSLPRLRELLGDAGVQLGDAQVGQQQREAQARQMAGDSGGRSSDGRGGGAGQGTDSDTVLEQGTEQLQRHSGRLANGRLDFYV